MQRLAWIAWLGLVALLALGRPAAAQGIDCTKARSPTEKAICANPDLLALDRQSAAAYSDALARQPDRQDALRGDLLRWLKARDAACALPARAVPACLRGQISARIAALAPPAAAPAPPVPAPPAPASPPAASPSATPPAAPAPQTLVTDAAPVLPPDPAVPATALPSPAATLDRTSLPASTDGETLLHVTAPGRFAITAKSPGGTALQLIDMLAGPGEVSGIAGSQDGRIDALLDVGIYKLRVMAADKATGAVALAVLAFHDAAPPRALPQPGRPVQDTLRDGEQRAFWFAVPAPGAVRIEAAGRSLADLRLWRDGRDLVPTDPAVTTTEPVPGHGLTDIRLDGKLEPGTYLAIAYGGPPATWTDNDPSQPFLLRAGVSDALAGGWAGGTMGPFGSEVYAVPAAASLLRLRLPAAAAATLAAGNTDSIDRRSREPVATLFVQPGQQSVVEVRAAAGQAFTLRALQQPSPVETRPGTYWVSAVANGTGGDEVPPLVLLERGDRSNRPPRIVADTLPRLGPGAWRARFNIRGRTVLPAQTGGGPVAVQTTGAPVTVQQGAVANLPAGYYTLSLQPQPGVQGAVELVAGPPGASAPPAQAMPPDPVLPLGTQVVGPGERLMLSGVDAPGVALGLSARPVPVALAEGPLAVSLAAGAGIDVPVRLLPGTALSVAEVGVGPVPYARADGAGPGGITVTVPPADHPRTVVLLARRPPATPAPIPAPPPLAALPSVQAGTPGFFDLQRDRERTFNLLVAEGGLFRVETLGRLRTAGRLGTAFIPGLAEADANGVGQNMLIQKVLRAGRYRVAVRAEDSTGHAGFLASPAPLLSPGTLLPGGSVRATLPGGSGAAIPLVIDAPQAVHLDVASLGDPWTGRLEDADGWPLTVPGPLDGIERKLAPGRYRLLVEPAATARQVVARLRTVPPSPPPIAGHGPHPLPFDAPQAATWREPDSQDAPRTPDTWTFSLLGAADVTLTLPDTMVGSLQGPDGAPQRVFKQWTGHLDAGTYRLDVTALGRNDRAPYAVSLRSDQLQPGVPRAATLPATLPFAVATSRVVSLTTFGTLPVKAVLRNADGTVMGRYRARADDWNVAVSRPLAAGSYTLELSAANAPDVADTARVDPPGVASSSSDDSDSDSSGDSSSSGDAAPADSQAAQTAASQSGDAPAARPSRPAADTSDDSDAPQPTVEVRLALPAASDPVAAPVSALADAPALPGAGVHVLAVEPPPAGSLLVAGAQAAAPLVLTLERRNGDGWDVVALDEGRAPAVAVPADAGPAAWRAEVWAVDGGPEPVRAAVRAVAPDAQAPGRVALAGIDGMPAPLAAAHVQLAGAGLLSVADAPDGVRAGGWPGHPLRPLSGSAVLPQGRDVWLLGPAGTLAAAPLQPAPGEAVALTVPDGLVATLPAVPAEDGAVRLWRARSGTGQPSLGAAMGYAPNGAVALAGPPVPLRAADGDTLRLSLHQDRLSLLPPQAVEAALHATLPPGAALPVTLPGGDKAVDAVLPPGTAAIPDWQGTPGGAAWAGSGPVTRTMAGAWTSLLLVNTTRDPAAVSLLVAPAPAAPALAPGGVVKRFFGAGGSFELAVDGRAGARLRTAGPATVAFVAADGAVATGTDVAAPGPGRAVVTHEAGAVAVWMEAEGASPWPPAAAQPAVLPSRVALAGSAMAFAVRAGTPVLLHATTTAPVLLALAQPGRTDPPASFPSGAELHRILPAGTAELRAYSATDGPLSGTLDLRAEPVLPVSEGLGPSVSVAPGGAAAFGFAVGRATTVGIGVQTDSGGTAARLLDATGHVVGEGVAMLATLQPGRYVLEATVPPDGGTAVLRPAVVGLAPRPDGPPPDVVNTYLELVGMKPQGTAR